MGAQMVGLWAAGADRGYPANRGMVRQAESARRRTPVRMGAQMVGLWAVERMWLRYGFDIAKVPACNVGSAHPMQHWAIKIVPFCEEICLYICKETADISYGDGPAIKNTNYLKVFKKVHKKIINT